MITNFNLIGTANFDRIFIMHSSYRRVFGALNDGELTGLCKHDLLLENVHQELKIKSLETIVDAVNVVEPIATNLSSVL